MKPPCDGDPEPWPRRKIRRGLPEGIDGVFWRGSAAAALWSHGGSEIRRDLREEIDGGEIRQGLLEEIGDGEIRQGLLEEIGGGEIRRGLGGGEGMEGGREREQ